MQYPWLILASGVGFLLGNTLVKYLSVHPTRMSLFLSASWVLLFTLSIVLGLGFQKAERPAAILASCLCFIAGYVWMTSSVLNQQGAKPLPALTRSPDGPNLGHTAVVYFTHGEAETYDPSGRIERFKEADRRRTAPVPLPMRPFFFHALRGRYLALGRSDHRRMHQQMLASLEKAYWLKGGEAMKFYMAFLDDDPRPDAAVIQALNEGASRVIVAEVFLTISDHNAHGQELIRRLRAPEATGVPIIFTGPLFDSRPLRQMFLERANAQTVSTPRSKVGILLVGHGYPDPWDSMWPAENAQELLFMQDLRDLLEADGYRRDNISMAWAAFKQPRPRQVIEQLLKQGIEKLLYFPAAISADSMVSRFDIPRLVQQARLPAGFPAINMGAWNDDPLVTRAIQEKIDARNR